MEMRQTFQLWSPEVKGNRLAFIDQLPSNDKRDITIERIEQDKAPNKQGGQHGQEKS
jgi:hypothetical protein